MLKMFALLDIFLLMLIFAEAAYSENPLEKKCLNNGSTSRDWHFPDREYCKCFGGWGGLTCESKVTNAFDSNPCKNDGLCLTTFDGIPISIYTRSSKMYICECKNGFHGEHCEDTTTDFCSVPRCANGRCISKNPIYNQDNLPRNFQCECARGFTGPNCDIQIYSDCKNDGHSYMPIEDTGMGGTGERPICLCSCGLTGEFCEIKGKNRCDSVKLSKNMVCLDSVHLQELFIECKNEYMGNDCSLTTRESSKNWTCLNGGVFYLNASKPACACSRQYTGPHCENKTKFKSSCSPNPCLNGGTCRFFETETFAGDVCVCKNGFGGTKCETKVKNYCTETTCKNKGICHSIYQQKKSICDCQNNFYGSDCSKELKNHCLNNKCQNNASCFVSDDNSNYICRCRFENNYPTHIGVFCEKKFTDVCLNNKCNERGYCMPERTTNYATFKCECMSGHYGSSCEKQYCNPSCSSTEVCVPQKENPSPGEKITFKCMKATAPIDLNQNEQNELDRLNDKDLDGGFDF